MHQGSCDHLTGGQQWTTMSDGVDSQPERFDSLPEPVENKAVRTFPRNKITQHAGRLLWFRVRVQGMLTSDAWLQLFPGTTAKPRIIQVG